MRQIILDSNVEGKRLAILKEGIPVAFFWRSMEPKAHVGDLFLTSVDKVMPGVDGVFVSLPYGEKGFLPKSEWPAGAHPRFDHIQKKDLILLQVKREAYDHKQPLMTRNIQIKGSVVIYLPLGDYIAVSKKTNEKSRNEIKEKWRSLVNSPEGIILRHAAKDTPKQEILGELEALRTKWIQVQNTSEKMTSPAIIGRGAFLSEEIKALLPSNEEREWRTNDQLEQHALLRMGENVHFQQSGHLFEDYGLNKEWELTRRPTVYLKSGITLVIEQTTALTSIDVNTGTFKEGHSKEETAYLVNSEVVPEIARQLALRQIGGIILIDLLKMENPVHRKKIQESLQKTLSEDLLTTQIAGYTNLGLLELTRKRLR